MKRLALIFVICIAALTTLCSAQEVSLDTVNQTLTTSVTPHPRLYINDKQLAEIKEKIKNSKDLEIIQDQIIRQTDKILTREPVLRLQNGRRMGTGNNLFNLAWAYRTTGEKKYLHKAEEQMIDIANFYDWNPSHYLDTALATEAMAIGYDWLYNDLSEQTRQIVRKAIVEKGINTSTDGQWYNWWQRTTSNWNQVCNTGITCGALAVIEDEPALAAKIVHRAVNTVQLSMDQYEPDGAYPEGVSYWHFGTTYNVRLIAALDSALSTNFGLSDKKGFSKTAEFIQHMQGPTEMVFNYGDCAPKAGFNPTVAWFAAKYNNPQVTWSQQKFYKDMIGKLTEKKHKRGGNIMSLIWTMPESIKPVKLSWMGRGHTPVAIFRTSWEKDASFLAIKGGVATTSHAQMDAGSFVIDALGQRWAMDLSSESYGRIESLGLDLWAQGQNSDRWKIFRYSNFAHNTLTINDQLQNASGFAPIVRYCDNKDFPHAAIDLTKTYKGQIKKALRGASVLPNGQILIQDQIQANDKPATVRWNMVTPAKVEIKSDTAATLTQNEKQMQFKVVTDSKVKVATYSTAPRKSYDSENKDTIMIGFDIKLKANETATIQVIMTPGTQDKPVEPKFINITNWSPPLTAAKHCKK